MAKLERLVSPRPQHNRHPLHHPLLPYAKFLRLHPPSMETTHTRLQTGQKENTCGFRAEPPTSTSAIQHDTHKVRLCTGYLLELHVNSTGKE